MTPPIVIEDVWARRGGIQALTGLSLTLGAGEVLAVLGPSGSGKTSLLRVVLGFLAPERGRVLLAGEVASADGHILRPPEERNLAVVFQDLALWPHLTVHGNLAFGLEAKGMPRSERDARIAEMLGRVGLGGKERRHPAELSGGERQRVAIARALVLDPHALLLDEPLSNLDVGLRRELLATFRELLVERHVPAIFVTHEPREAASLGDRIAVLASGRVIQTGRLDELRAAPADGFVERLLDDLDWNGLPRA